MPEYIASPPTLTDGQRADFRLDSTGALVTTGGGGGGAVTVADAANVVEGATTDAAVVSDTTGTMNAKLRGLVKWAFERMPASLGQKTMANSLAVALASDQSAIPLSASSAVIGHVIVDSLPSNVSAPSNAKANAANGTDVAVVSSSASKVIYVVGAVIVAGAAAAQLTFNSKPAGAGTAISATWHLAANGGFVWPCTGNGAASLCQTNSGEGLTVTTTAAVDVHVLYVQV